MKSAKMPNGTKRYPVAIYLSQDETRRIDSFFEANTNLKKGETIKGWILKGIDQDFRIRAGRTQIDIDSILERKVSNE